jgi:hypothetical protein
MQREMLTKEGAMYTSLSAVDDKDVEGGYYTWTREQLKKRLSDDERKIFESKLVPTSASRFEAGHLPVWIKGYQASMQLSAEDEKLLRSARAKLLSARESDRELPVDDKLVSGLNGLALSAFARMAKLEKDSGMRDTADQLSSYIKNRFWNSKQLLQARRGEKTSRRATLADYAYVAEGMWHYYQLTKASADREIVRQLVDLAWQRFHSPAGWLLGGASIVESDGREGIIDDGPTASPSAILLRISHSLARETGDSELEERVKKALGYDPLKLNSNPFWYATQVSTIRKVFVPKN